MTKYIELEAVIKMAKPYWQTDEDGFGVEWLFNKEPIIFKKDVEAIPTADVAPVRHGKWIELGKYSDGYNWRCSVCKRESVMAVNYCPFCGALMDKDGERYVNISCHYDCVCEYYDWEKRKCGREAETELRSHHHPC